VCDYLLARLPAVRRTERGASAVEYGLLVALIALTIVLAVSALGNKLELFFTTTSNALP
jgi:pilus assembly protein Flp/PilA